MSMLRITLILTAISAFLYLVFSFMGWFRQATRVRKASNPPRRAYFWGLSFAVLFYYGFPIWWWRYGFWKTMQLLIGCIASGAALQAILRSIGAIEVDDFGESLAMGLLLAVPIRAAAGIWVAGKDAEWRHSIVLKRTSGSRTAEN